jgi:hypothetical protein
MQVPLGHWPLGEQDILATGVGNTGVGTPTTFDATLYDADGNPQTTTAGSTVFLIVATLTTVTTPSGFVAVSTTSTDGVMRLYVFRRFGVAGAEGPTWTITQGAGVSASWVALEVSRVRNLTINSGSANWATSVVRRVPTSIAGSTLNTPVADVLCLAIFASKDGLGQEVTWTDHTEGFGSPLDTCTTKGSASNVALSVVRQFPGAAGNYGCEATASQSCQGAGYLLFFQGEPWTPTAVASTGFEFGTLAGIATGTVGNKLFDGAVNTAAMSIVTGLGGAGSAVRLSRTASGYLEWTTDTLGVGFTTIVRRVKVKVDAATGTPALMGFTTAAGQSCVVSYVAATGKVRVQVGSGTAVDSVQAPGLGVAMRIDLYFRCDAGPYFCQWMLNGVEQVTATSQGGLSPTTLAASRPVGWSDAVTVDGTYDDVLESLAPGDYPVGDGRGILLGVDPAGTVTLTGTTANFQTFTTNGGALAAWNATTARDAVKEVPPLIGASATGFCQITAAAGDYVELPMTSYTMVGLERVNAVRLVVCGWAASTTANHVGLRAISAAGGGEQSLFSGDPAFDNSTTTPGWCCAKHPALTISNQVWPQAWLDGLAARVGYSSDATPDVGVHALYFEVDICAGTRLEQLLGQLGGVTVQGVLDPATGAVQTLEVTTPVDQGTTLHVTTDAGQIDRSIAADTVLTEPIASPVTVVEVVSDNEDPDRA